MPQLQHAGAPQAWVRDVTRDAIRHFAWGIGDNNPLWLDPEYAAKSLHHGLLAPPCFAYALHETTVAPGLDPRQRVYQSVDWQWLDVIRLGADLTVTAALQDTANDATGTTQIGCVEYRDAQGALIAAATTHCRRPLEPRAIGPEQPEGKYTAGELEQIEGAILGESRYGDRPQYWDDVTVGSPLGPLTKGPLSIMDIVAWCAGALGVPEDADRISVGGLSEEVATGPQLVSWCAQALTDWASDAGFLHRLRVEIAEQPGLGSTTVVAGSVTHRWQAGANHAAQIALTASGRDGRLSATATAIVLLPTHTDPVRLPVAQRIDLQRNETAQS